MSYDFISVGDITTDVFIELDDAVVTETSDGKHIKLLAVRFGDKVPYRSATEVRAVGNAANAAVSAHRLGLKTAFVTDLGDDQVGENCLNTLAKEGMSREYISVHPGMRSNYHYVLKHGVERTILVKQEDFPYKLPDFSEPPKWFYFSSVGEQALEYSRALATYAAESGASLTFQPGTFQIQVSIEKLFPVYRATTLFVCNREEAAHILQTGLDDIKLLLHGIHKLGPKIVAITDGPSGAYASNGSKVFFVPMYPDPAPPVSRTGAGDAFASTLTTYLCKDLPLPEALLRAPVNSASVVQHVGAQGGLLSHEDLEDWLAKAPKNYSVKEL